MNETSYVIVTTTVGTEELAVTLSELITSAKLAACVQFWPIRSVYRWQEKIETGGELMLQCKTQSSLVPALEELIRTHHPYEIPEIIVTPIIGGHPPYLEWIRRETLNKPET